jgi:hypothetical protein
MPRNLPIVQARNPADAGFCDEWAKRALSGEQLEQGHDLYMAITSKNKMSDDRWASGVEQELRSIFQAATDSTHTALTYRVFCNDIGCLSYLEQTGAAMYAANAAYFASLRDGGRLADNYGLTTENAFYYSAHDDGIFWELLVLKKPPATPGS